MPKILICYVKAGMGHFSNAKTLKSKIKEAYPENDIELYDVLGNSKLSFLDGVFNSTYMTLVNKLPFVWVVFINVSKIYPVAILFKFSFNRIIRSKLRKKIWHYEPDVVVSTYYFIADAVSNNSRKSSSAMSIYTMVTDTFSPHSIWFRVKSGKFIVSSQEAYFTGKKYLKDSGRIKKFGYLFNEKYNRTIQKNRLDLIKVKFGLNKTLKTILVLGGGGGLKDADLIYKEIYRQKKNINIVVVCGLNQKQENLLNKISNKNPNAKIVGYTNCVQELINISDIVISKAGPATVLEVLSQKKRIFLTSYIPDQEKGNKDFVVDNNLGSYSENIKELVQKALNYLSDPDEIRRFQLNLKKYKIKSDIESLIDYINLKSKKNIPYNKKYR